MSRTKDYLNPETPYQQTATHFTAAPKGRAKKQQTPSGQRTMFPGDGPTMDILLQQLGIRLRRTWVSARFRFHAATFGMLENRGTAKFAGLLLAGWFFLSSDRDLSTLADNPLAFVFGSDGDRRSEERLGETPETQFDVAPGSGGGTRKPVSQKTANDAAPIAVGGLSTAQAEDYIGRFSKIARAEMDKFGIPASISLAQGLVESRGGLSTLARRNNNHFGMKCFSRKCRKGHCSNHTDDSHKDFFRVYKNAWESWRAHSEMLASGRYASLKKYGTDYKKWAYGLKSIGYATDREYAEKLIGMIERYDLHKYDR